jgi:hypothetical protein
MSQPSKEDPAAAAANDLGAEELEKFLSAAQAMLSEKQAAIEAELKTHGLDSPEAIRDYAMALEAADVKEAASARAPSRAATSAVRRHQRI